MASGIAFTLFLAYYLITFRRYQAAVEKHASLTALFNDPSVRVVSGDQAKTLLLSTEDNTEEDVNQIQRGEQMQIEVDKKRAQLFQAIQREQQQKPKFNYELCENFEIELQPQTTFRPEKRQETSYPLSFNQHSGF